MKKPTASTWNCRLAAVIVALEPAGWTHAQIASALNGLGLTTWRGKPWTRVRIVQAKTGG